MTLIREHNLSTGHTETLARVPSSDAPAMMARFDDHSTDHVVFLVSDGPA